ncbi:ExbD/TolR family protein [Roseobacter weihaiensis]|uniref:ExbD/TolR family protein n=1 Tax=Roseobacter weihaiensis TaxID=2763262 RepID=UPI001D0B53F6|nr:biopolymer transporter ExbD [Roseobacter sp. H9]
MVRRQAPAKSQREPTIALINIVFLMLVFFMVAGTLSHPLDRTLSLVKTTELEGRAPPDTLVIHADGRLAFRGTDQPDIQRFFDSLAEDDRQTIRLVPDRDLPAQTLVTLTRDLRAAGAERIIIVTERSLR